jgi:hypothetical protein
MDEKEITARLFAAYERLQFHYTKGGGWRDRYRGYPDAEDGFGYVGPLAWSEADYQFLYATELAREFQSLPSLPMVHLELPIRIGTRADLPADAAGKPPRVTHVDIVVTDPEQIPYDAVEATEAFRTQRHHAFIEVKWFHKGSPRWLEFNWQRKVVGGVQPDLHRLADHKATGRCQVAAMLLIDDTGAYRDRYDELDWPDSVLRLSVDERHVSDWGLHGE